MSRLFDGYCVSCGDPTQSKDVMAAAQTPVNAFSEGVSAKCFCQKHRRHGYYSEEKVICRITPNQNAGHHYGISDRANERRPVPHSTHRPFRQCRFLYPGTRRQTTLRAGSTTDEEEGLSVGERVQDSGRWGVFSMHSVNFIWCAPSISFTDRR